jgi:hypothetical protein
MSNKSKVSCLGYVHNNIQGMPQVTWVIVSLARMDIVQDAGDVVHSNCIPEYYHKYLRVFSQRTSDALPWHRSYDPSIEIKEGKEPPWGPIYALFETELAALREYLEEISWTRKITPSKSLLDVSILFVLKVHGRSLCLYVDYRGLNQVTILNRYPLPLIKELCNQVQGSRIVSKVNLKSEYNLIRIKEGNEWKMAFRTHYGYYKYLVILCRLANAPATV